MLKIVHTINEPTACPVCGGEGVIAAQQTIPSIGNTSVGCDKIYRFNKPCKPCNGLGAIWAPLGAENNWPLPIEAFIYDHSNSSVAALERLNGTLGDFRKCMNDHVYKSKENNVRELLDIINDPQAKRLIL